MPTTLPTTVEAEEGLIAACLMQPNLIDEVSQIVRPTMFSSDRNGKIMESIIEIRESGSTPDNVTVSTHMKKRGEDSRSIVLALIAMTDSHFTPVNGKQYARMIYESWMRRQMVEIGTRLSEDARDEGWDAFGVSRRAESDLMRLIDQASGGRLASIREVIKDTQDQIQTAIERRERGEKIHGVPSGHFAVDRRYGGWQKGQLFTLAARPSVGKTALGMQWAFHAAKLGEPVLIHSLEMSSIQLMLRQIAQQCGVPMIDLVSGALDEGKRDLVKLSFDRMVDLPIYVDETPGIDVRDIWSRARIAKRRHGIKLLIVDYLQIVTCSTREKRVEQVDEIAKTLKNIARDLDLPVIALAQLNREVEHRRSRRPVMSDLKESSGIEEASDAVMMLYRPHMYDDDPNRTDDTGVPRPTGYTELITVKNRHGSTGTDLLLFRPHEVKFNDWDQMPIEDDASHLVDTDADADEDGPF